MWLLVESFENSGAIQRIKVNGDNYDDYITLSSWVDSKTAEQNYLRMPTYYI